MHDDDQNNLMNVIKKRLKKGHNFRKFDVITHDDNNPGENEATALKRLMRLSKRSILVVTENFFQSVHCQLCINMMMNMANTEGANK